MRMRNTSLGLGWVVAAVLIVLVVAFERAPIAPAQTRNAAFARTPDGKPNLNGIWQVLSTAAYDLEDHNAANNVHAGRSAVDGGTIPYQDWAVAKKKENYAKRADLDPVSKCYLPGVPRITYMPFP